MAAQILDLSDKLRAFALRVEAEVKRPLKIDGKADPNASNFSTYADSTDKTYMRVVIDPTVSGWSREQSIAHEMIHWLLWRRRFKNVSCLNSNGVRKSQYDMLSALSTVIDDVAVHNIQDTEGFGPYNNRFRKKLEIELDYINRSMRPYGNLSGFPVVTGTYVSCGYAMAWSSIQYHELNSEMETFLQGYMQAVKQNLPDDYAKARTIVSAVEKYGVFEPEGQSKAFAEVVKVWGLAGLCQHSIVDHLF
jgi:hypothetical protein